MLLTAGLAAVGLPLATAGPAAAATAPNKAFAPMTGSTPDVAVAPDGTGYVIAVRDDSPGNEGLLGLCRIPRGARKCDLTRTFAAGPSYQFLATAPYVFAPNAVDVDVFGYVQSSVTGDPSQLKLWRSHDRGVTFDAGTAIGSINPNGDLVLGPGNSATGITDTETFGVHVQNSPLDGSAATAVPTSLTANEYATSIVALADGSMLAASSSAVTCPCGLTVQRAAPGANLDDPASWQDVYSGSGTYTRLATGQGGTYLMSFDTGSDTWRVQKWTGSTFTKPAKLTKTDDENRMALRETANGYLYALVQGAADTSGRALELFRSRDGVHWTERGLGDDSGFEDSFALANDQGGFAANDALSYSGKITVVPIPVPRAVTERAAKGKVGGQVLPLTHRSVVALQVKHGKTWLTVRKGATNKAGKYSITLPTLQPGTKATVRVIAVASEGYAEADGKNIVVG